jgi:hypothetical protein
MANFYDKSDLAYDANENIQLTNIDTSDGNTSDTNDTSDTNHDEPITFNEVVRDLKMCLPDMIEDNEQIQIIIEVPMNKEQREQEEQKDEEIQKQEEQKQQEQKQEEQKQEEQKQQEQKQQEQKQQDEDLIRVPSEFNEIYLSRIAPTIPYYMTLLATHITTSLSIDTIIDLLVKGLKHFSVAYYKNTDNNCSLECYALVDSSVINFVISIYLKNEHIIEFRHWNGCRFNFNNLIQDLTTYINLPIKTGWSPLRMPPTIDITEFPEFNLEECEQTIDIAFIKDSLDKDLNSDLEYGLKTIHNLIITQPHYFEKDEVISYLMDILIHLYKKYEYYFQYKVLVYDSLCHLAKIVKPCHNETILKLILESLTDTKQYIIESTLYGLANINIPIHFTESEIEIITKYSTFYKESISTNALTILSKL